MRQTPLLKRNSTGPTLMAGKAAGKAACRSVAGASRALEQAVKDFQGAPRNPHAEDALVALKSALREVQSAEACARAMAKGVR